MKEKGKERRGKKRKKKGKRVIEDSNHLEYFMRNLFSTVNK